MSYSVLECSKKGEKMLKKCWKSVEKKVEFEKSWEIMKSHEISWKIMKYLEKNLEKVLKIC